MERGIQGVRLINDLRILDLTDEKGMFCARLLADMGGEVIRVDRPGTDVTGNLFYSATSAGKIDITLNIETERGKALFRRLARSAQIIIESYSPGYMDSLGLGYESLSALNPGLIMVSITGFGQSGPYKDYKASDLVAGALGGWLSVCGEPGMAPLTPFGQQAYHTASLFAANGILLALWHRHATGKGQHIDISIMDCVAATLDHVLVRYFYEGEVAQRRGSLYWNNAFRIFPCRDGYILLTLFYQWETLVGWLASEGMAADLEMGWTTEERNQKVEHVIEVLEGWTKRHNVDELVEKGQLMRFPWAKVASIPGVLSSPQMAARRFFVEVEQGGKKYKAPGVPCRLSRSPWQVGRHIPSIGEHNRQVYKELGISEEELKTLLRDGII